MADDPALPSDRAPAWWQTETVYQIYPRSFADGNGDGIGDLTGLLAHLDHLAWLGVGAIWLSPIYPSPMADFGYDVAEYCDVDAVFGTLDDVDRLIAAAHQRDIRVLLDWVPNHTSDQHPWFEQSRSSRTNPKRNWYVWRDRGPDGALPNNWLSSFTNRAPAWTDDEVTGQVYLHTFLPQQPDLNWDEPAVEAAMHDTLRFWLDRGVDGIRADVVHLIGKELDRDDDAGQVAAGIPHTPLNDCELTHDRLRRLRQLLDSYEGDRMMVGEVYLLSPAKVAAYYGHGDELHLSFNFAFTHQPWDAGKLRGHIERTYAVLDPIGAWPTWVLSNHDLPRHRTRYGAGEARARAAATLLLTLRGTPFLYQGEELGLQDAVVPAERVVDPGGRDGCRAPMPWLAEAGHGWPAEPWLPFPPDAAGRSVERLLTDDTSILHLYRRLLALRRAHPALHRGTFRWLEGLPGEVLGFERADGDDRFWIVVSTADEWCDVELARPAEVVLSSGSRRPGPFDAHLAADEAVVLRPV